MKRFSDFSIPKRINEQETVLNVQVEKPKEETTNEVTNQEKSSPVSFFSKLLESREMAQVYHWTVKGDMGSHAAHTALNEYYDSIIEKIDELVEVYTGQYDLVEGYEIIDTTGTKTKDKIEYFQGIAEYIKENRYKAISEEDTHLQNTIDEVVSLVYKLLYKLRFNK